MKVEINRSFFSIIIIFFLTIIVLFLNSCATNHSGVLSSNNDLRNVKYVDFAFGHSKTTAFLGIGGYKHDALVLEAKLNMMRNFPLKSNQFYGNFIVDHKTTRALGITTNLITVSADILEEKSTKENEMFSEMLKTKLGISDGNSFFAISDTVVDENNLKYIITSTMSEQVIVNPIGSEEKRYSKLIKNENELFSMKKNTYQKNEKGLIIQFHPGNNISLGDGFLYKIIAVNKNSLLLKNETTNVYFTKPIEEINM